MPLPPLAVCASVLFAALHGQDEGGHDADGMTGGVLLCRLGSGSAEQQVAEQQVALLLGAADDWTIGRTLNSYSIGTTGVHVHVRQSRLGSCLSGPA